MTVTPTLSTWGDVLHVLRDEPLGSVVRVRRGVLLHPEAVGMKLSAGLPMGQRADYLFALGDGSGLHVREFVAHYEAHLDEVRPNVDLVAQVRRDAPGAYVAGGVALGAALGGALGRDRESALLGALVGGIVAAMAANEGRDS